MTLEDVASIARILQAAVSLLILASIYLAYISWRSKQSLDQRSLALAYSITRNKQYFDARVEISNRFKARLESNEPLSDKEIKELKDNNDKILSEIRFLLSHWEIMAISIFDHIIDEKTCFEMVGATLVDTVSLLEPLIADMRKQRQNRRRYDYLLILFEDWKRRLDANASIHSKSRYSEFLKLGKDRKAFERKLASSKSDW